MYNLAPSELMPHVKKCKKINKGTKPLIHVIVAIEYCHDYFYFGEGIDILYISFIKFANGGSFQYSPLLWSTTTHAKCFYCIPQRLYLFFIFINPWESYVKYYFKVGLIRIVAMQFFYGQIYYLISQYYCEHTIWMNFTNLKIKRDNSLLLSQ